MKTEFFCNSCQRHKDVSQQIQHKRCKSCDEKISAIREDRYRPSAKKVYTDPKITHIAR